MKDKVGLRSKDGPVILVGLVVVALFWGTAGTMLLTHRENVSALIAGLVVAGYTLMSALAARAAWRALRASMNVEARTWRNIGIGLTIWTVGGIPYLGYLALGGDPLAPAAWTQIGYLAAYPFWYRALWHLRQPVLASSRLRQLETVLIEFAALFMFVLVVGSVLWNPQWPAAENIAQLIPAALDVLLLASFYGAVRRSHWTANSALTWLGYAFAMLAISDALLTYFVARSEVLVGAMSTSGYVVAMVMIIIASRRPLRVSEVQNRVRGTAGIVAVVGLALTGMAIKVAPEVLDPISFVVSAYLAWRLFAILNERDNSDGDLLTGFMEPRAFERHLGGVIQQSSDERPALLIAVDLDGFGAWNARNGYSAGDEMLASVAAMLESESPNGAVWGRLKGDRFALTTKSLGIMADRELAEHLQAVAVQGAAPLSARAAIIQLPQDAQRTAEALDAADETLRAGSAGGRSVVAYSSGGMDGLSPVPGYASLGTRREKIQALIASTESIQIVLQPIVHIDALTICGFEALSRFHTDPRHGPDEWISEATLLGLGIDLEIECARRAWRRRNDIGGAAHIAINLSPEAILSEMLSDAIDSEDLEGLVVEITEHERVLNYPRLAARLASLRGRGAKIAVDDMGAGHASLSHLIELKPDFIKLDRKLVTGLDLEPGKHALVRNMLRLSSDLGAQLIAEGIETMGELTALRELGVPLGQGYFLGRPTEETEEHFERLAAASSLRSASSPVA
jgi:diguanylate cyclase (GGDEF)-like protein